MEDRNDYECEGGIAAWWDKDGAWHIALPYTPTEQDRKLYPVSYPEGSDGPFYQWTADSYNTRLDAIAAIPQKIPRSEADIQQDLRLLADLQKQNPF